jgi:hypothetical protein
MMKIKYLVIGLFLILVIIPSVCFAKKPTGTVIDEETGKPVEGAVAICIWRRGEFSLNGFFEGGFEVVSKIIETTSDKEGNFYIPGYWGINIISQPNLNVYKFGYVLWDSNSIFMDGERSDFNKDNRIVILQKWPKDFSFVRHFSYIYSATGGAFSKSEKQLFENEYQKERPYFSKEIATRDRSQNSKGGN